MTLGPVAIFLSGALIIRVYKCVAVMALDLWMFTQILFISSLFKTIYLLNILAMPLNDVK